MPTPLLGTASWGWKIPAPTAFDLLDAFYAAGLRQIDTATNYPINKIPADFRKAETILTEWMKTHGVHDLQITAKVGSINNLRSPEHLLTQSFLLMCLDEYQRMWGNNLDTFMVHWDNREEIREIQDTLQALAFATAQGLKPGLSGIKRPDLYAELNKDFHLDFRIQFKHHVLESAYEHYKPFHGTKRFVAYGINAGGAKIGADPSLDFLKPVLEKANRDKSRPPIEHFYQVGLLFAYQHPDIEGILIGPSSVKQLEDNLTFLGNLRVYDYTDFFEPQRR
ncbi:MAG: aldo/keto reductase [Saprospirales bacterium]|nr:aldo/keto reductase [Saprospirales bacterium]